MTIIKHDKLTWIDVEKPTAQDILFFKEKFNLHPLVLDEFTSPSQRPRAEEFENCLYIVIHVPLFDRRKRVTSSGEMDIVITPRHLITVHQTENIPLKAIIKEFQTDEALRQQAMSRSVGYLFYVVLEKLISSCFPKIDHINEKIDKIEEGIFSGKEKEMVQELSVVKRDVLSFRRILKPQRSILESLVQKKYILLEKELNQYFQDLIGTNIRV
jgi:magnesium transporter